MKRLLLLFLFYCLYIPKPVSANSINWKTLADNPDFLHRAIKEITDVMVHDVYSPPVASRTYAYISIAAYEAARQTNSNYLSLAGQLQQLTFFNEPDPKKQYSFSLAAINAVLLVGKTMVISEGTIEDFRKKTGCELSKISGISKYVF